MGRKGKRKVEKDKKPLRTWQRVLLIILTIILMFCAIVGGIATYFITDKLR